VHVELEAAYQRAIAELAGRVTVAEAVNRQLADTVGKLRHEIARLEAEVWGEVTTTP